MPKAQPTPPAVFAPATEADRRLIAALAGDKGLDIDAAIKALEDGANPNRPREDKWNPGHGYALYYSVIQDFDRHQVVREMGEEAFKAAHLKLLKAMVKAGADFSLPLFPGVEMSCSDIASAMWESRSADPEALLVFAKAGGYMGELISEKSFCCMLNHDALLGDASRMSILWEAGLGARIKSSGFETTILTRLLGKGGGGSLKAALWLMEKGARCAPLIENGMTSDQVIGYSALHLLGVEAAFYSQPESKPTHGRRPRVTLDSLTRCAELAVQTGALINAYDGQGRTAIQVAMMKADKNHPELSLAWCRKLASMGALPIKTANGAPMLAHACADTELALEQIEIAIAMGSEPKNDGARAALALINRASSDQLAARALTRLASLGADFKQGVDHPAQSALLPAAAKRGLLACVKALIKAGCDPRWSSCAPPESLAGICCELSCAQTTQKKSTDAILKIVIEARAPLELRDEEGFAPLHWAAKSLESAKCEALLAAGASPNARDKEKKTPLMLAAKRFGPRLDLDLNKTLAVFEACESADWTLVDKKGASAFTQLSAKGSPEALIRAASRDPRCLDEATKAGAISVATLKKRGGGCFEKVEKALLESSGLARAKARSGAKSI